MAEKSSPFPGPPEANLDDAAYAVAKGAIASIPVAGSALAEIATAFLAPPLEARRDKWLQLVASAITELREQKGVSIEELQSNEDFVSLVLTTTQIALRNHHAVKLECLRNAIKSGYSPTEGEAADETHVFLRLIEELSVSQLRFVSFFGAYGVLPGHVNGLMFPDQRTPSPSTTEWLAAPLERELIDRGLYSKREAGPNAPYRLTDLGYRFRVFVRGYEIEEERKWMEQQPKQEV